VYILHVKTTVEYSIKTTEFRVSLMMISFMSQFTQVASVFLHKTGKSLWLHTSVIKIITQYIKVVINQCPAVNRRVFIGIFCYYLAKNIATSEIMIKEIVSESDICLSDDSTRFHFSCYVLHSYMIGVYNLCLLYIQNFKEHIIYNIQCT